MGIAGYVGLRGPVKGTARTRGRPAPRRRGGRRALTVRLSSTR